MGMEEGIIQQLREITASFSLKTVLFCSVYFGGLIEQSFTEKKKERKKNW